MKHCQQEMTVIQNAWPVVCNFGWLIEADRNARKGKRYRAEVLNFTARLEDNLFTIQQGMMNGSYVLGPYRKLRVYVPKKRLVMALDYPDRIVQWSLYLYLNPIYDRLFIEDSYACRKDKGSHKAAKRLQYWMCQVQRKPGPGWYCLKLDISKYFYRVNHEKLLAILGRRVKDPAMMAFIRGVVNSRAEPFGLPRWRTPQDTPPEEWLYEVGMPIGNLTSQLFANIYLNELDQYCKHRLKIHYYIRYMDDVIILGQDKEERTMENPITRAEHEEFRRRLEEENKRQDTRIGILEDSVRQIGALATSVEKLAVSMQSMLKEQEKQGKRLEALEGRDGEKWRKVMGYIATAIVGIVLGYLFKRIGM